MAWGFINNERQEGFDWLMEQVDHVRQEINAAPPEVTITDYDSAMKNAVARVYPAARPQLCIFHINKNVNLKFHQRWDKSAAARVREALAQRAQPFNPPLKMPASIRRHISQWELVPDLREDIDMHDSDPGPHSNSNSDDNDETDSTMLSAIVVAPPFAAPRGSRSRAGGKVGKPGCPPVNPGARKPASGQGGNYCAGRIAVGKPREVAWRVGGRAAKGASTWLLC